MSRAAEECPVICGDLVDLGEAGSPGLAGILTPRAELGAAKIGITDQFLTEASTYHQRYSSVPYFRALIEEATRGRFAAEPSVILDIGSGAGNSVLPCLQLFPSANVVATDLSENLLAILRDHVGVDAAMRNRLTLVAVDATKPYFNEGTVDLVVGAAILHHLIDPAACIRQACRALRRGGIAVFFEPFEGGNAILRLAYDRILAMNSHAETLGIAPVQPEAAAWLGAIIEDLQLRMGVDKSAPIFRRIDDKWLFTRTYFETVVGSLDGISVEIEPINPSDHPFSMQTRINLCLVLGLYDEELSQALPEWAWQVLYRCDAGFSSELRRDLPIEARVIFTRHNNT